MELARNEWRRRALLALFCRHVAHDKRLASNGVEDDLRFDFIGNFDRFAVLLNLFRFELGRLAGHKPRENVPVLFRLEPLDLLLAIADQP